MSSTAVDLPRVTLPSVNERWYVLVMMCLIYAINIADRYVVSTVLEPIRLDLHLSDAGVAFLTGIPLAFFYVTCGIPISWLADRANRRNILSISLVLWSGMTAMCGLSKTYWQFLFARVGAGVGEAGGTPPSASIVSDCFPANRRPMALTVLALGAPIGAWIAQTPAGWVAHVYNWRMAFLALGVPGLLLGVIVYLTIREPARGRCDAANDGTQASLGETLRFMWQQKAAFHIVMGGGVCALWGWGLMYWTPAFLQRQYGLNVSAAADITSLCHLIGGSLATVGTAWYLSRPSMADPRRVAWLLTLGIGFAILPSFFAYWTHSLTTARFMFWLFIPAIYFYIGPCFGLLQNLAPCHMRSMFIAVSLLVANIFNLMVAPQLVGFVSDWLAGGHANDAASLRSAMLLLVPTGLWATYHLYLATKTIVADQQRALDYTKGWSP